VNGVGDAVVMDSTGVVLTGLRDSGVVELRPRAPREYTRMPVDRVDLTLLEALARIGAVDGAARMAGLVEPVARRRLKRLESRLGMALLTPTPGGAALTTAGHLLLSAGRRFLSALAVAVHDVAGDAAWLGPDGPRQLRLAAFGRTWDAFADDLAAHLPGVLLELTTAVPEEAVGLFERRAVDAAYVWQVPGDELRPSRPARVDEILDEPMWVALPVRHPCAAQPQVRLASLADDEWIVAPSSQSRRFIHVAGAAAGFRPRLGPTARGVVALRSLVAQGRGVAFVSPLVAVPAGEVGPVLRPLVDAPRRRHVLALDPAVGSRVRRLLHSRLRQAYAAKAALRNPAYRESEGFPAMALLAGGDDGPGPADQPDDDTDADGRAHAVPGPALAGPAGVVSVLELEDLHMLKVVAASGSLNRAAPLLTMTQPALSRRIQRLERRLGIPLFVRSYRGTLLSPAARQLLAAIAEAEAVLYRTLDTIRAHADARARMAAS
jgi:DNA-binding transcriptional LysR family regulator